MVLIEKISAFSRKPHGMNQTALHAPKAKKGIYGISGERLFVKLATISGSLYYFFTFPLPFPDFAPGVVLWYCGFGSDVLGGVIFVICVFDICRKNMINDLQIKTLNKHL